MTTSSRRAVITGLGVVTPIGCGAGAFWDSLTHGRGGVRRIQTFDPSELPTQFGGEVLDFDARQYLDKKDRKRLNVMPRSAQLAVVASQLALTHAALDKERVDPTRFGVVFGAGLLPTLMSELKDAAPVSIDPATGGVDLDRWGEQGIPLIPPMWMLSHVPNMVACHVSILHNAQGPLNSIVQSDLGSLLALGEAYRAIVYNRADVMLTGGGDTLTSPFNLARFCLFAPLSRRNDQPTRASRPFDRQRDGLVLGEGAGVIVLEELEHARQRGARIIAELVGFSAGFDRERTGTGLARVIRNALTEAHAEVEDVDHVNAHGLSTVPDDLWESAGLREALGAGAPVFAPKSYFGNLGAGSSAVELAASLLAFEHDSVPATLNQEEPDPACPVAVSGVSRPVTRPCVVKIGTTELGQCAALVCRRNQETGIRSQGAEMRHDP
ncbi:MAG: beta-ketoacyl-[acyl-carrier-protein] synthase family protein [Gemmataceae bacterium]|nr:beta-ketoacyl-[acyl-carrier-protein] synthase family protein [Gemmataceae bacterium]